MWKNTGRTRRVLQQTSNSHQAALLPRENEKLETQRRPSTSRGICASVHQSFFFTQSARDAQRLGRTSSLFKREVLGQILDFRPGVRKSGIFRILVA
jgi:hypothetical protein